ncbi:hypothetical protein LY28_01875 [Ruminiclostridium sufflavum DSM 19573]|uniref:Calcineurin-like phosphoesterase domain-containing protein n=1 Tax=Ruminiclostridium sufflavum DSM 19573 TaxID=1121337 RepID=A0A318XQ19_9FIRM|nr:metallophosphoesterase [Ruminiclostridium sufflavum]PYG87855.1 hypothetical protein LY28_01875 [Ruminiclostridium sufflavum DSM 19573]
MSTVGMVFGIAVMISFYGSANFYIGRRIFQCLRFLFPHINVTIFTGIYIAVALSLIIGYLPLPSGIKGIMGRAGAYWMGIFIYLLMLFLMADLIIFLAGIVRAVPNPTLQGIRFYEGLIVLLLAACFVGYGIYNANQIKYISYDIQAKKTAYPADMKIVMISDLHLGAVNCEKRLADIVQGINNLKPDIVCIAGDIFNDDYYALSKPYEAINLLRGIKTAYGVYASLGNHDSGKTFKEMVDFLEQSDIKLLNDEYVIINERLVLLGRVDSSPNGGFGELKRKDTKEILASIDTNMPVAVMDHTPANLDQYDGRIDLVLSGHTHRGQIFPFNLITNAIFTVDYGHYQKASDSPHFIVTSGAGTWGPPMRVGSDNEIVSILLR